MPNSDKAHTEQHLILEKWLGSREVKGAMLMTPREHDVCRHMISLGDNAYEKTADALGISPVTVGKHMKSVRTKLGFRSTMSVLLWLQRWYHLTDGWKQPQAGLMASTDNAGAAGVCRPPADASDGDGT